MKFCISLKREFKETLTLAKWYTENDPDAEVTIYFINDTTFDDTAEEFSKIAHLHDIDCEDSVELVDIYWDIDDMGQETRVIHYNKKALDILGIKY